MRSRFRPSHGTVVAYLALFVALGGTTYAATGGNFILGKANTASTPTSLASGATQALKVTNSTAHTGVWASGGSVANNAAAVHGQSTNGNAVEGISGKNTASGVYGQNDSTGYGVAGRSTNGAGVLGDSSAGWAFNAAGNATQNRTGNGFVKAMVHVVGGNGIQECFNSQLPPGQATTSPCGITFFHPGSGVTDLTFNFRVDDRFVVASPEFGPTTLSVHPVSSQNDELNVETDHSVTGSGVNTGYYLVVY